MSLIFVIHLSIDGHLGNFQFLGIMKTATMGCFQNTIVMNRKILIFTPRSLISTPASRIMRAYGNPMFNF